MPVTKDVMNPETAYVTVKLMEGVTTDGSGKRLRHSSAAKNSFYKKIMTGYPYAFNNPIAGKTGTTQNNSDGWFMGMVPNLVSGVWVGGEDRSVRFSSTRYGQGASMALPIWGGYMKSIYNDASLEVSTADFKEPENLSIEVDCEKFNNPVDDDGNPDDDQDLDDLDML
jgi:penicillin-binding protein 1A